MSGSAVGAPVVGIIGGGQLARMLAEAASPLGVAVTVLSAPDDEGADQVVVNVIEGRPDDPDAIRSLARDVDVVTIDHENVDWRTLDELEREGIAVRPALGTIQLSDKALQRRRFSELGLPVPPFTVIDIADRSTALDTVKDFFDSHAGPAGRIVAKASRGGYDGRGVWMLAEEDLEEFIGSYSGAPLVLEPVLDLDKELAVLVARSPSGETSTWPVVETVQVDGMCDEVIMPAEISPPLADEAAALAVRIAEEVGAVGVLAVELFVSRGQLVINEIAPRVHNSGHVTIEANCTSQFEQHLRAILDWPLGPTGLRGGFGVMRNVVGDRQDPRVNQSVGLASHPGAHLHLYGKTPRAARKLGHVTVIGDDVAACREAAAKVAASLTADTAGVGTIPAEAGSRQVPQRGEKIYQGGRP